MTRLKDLISLQGSSFRQKIEAALNANPLNDEEASAMLSDLVFAELTNGIIGDAALAVLDYEDAKDWIQSLFVTGISIVAQARGGRALDIEAHFFDAWLDSGRSRALAEFINDSVKVMYQTGDQTLCQTNVLPLFAAATADEEVRIRYRIALTRHVVVMSEKYPKLLVDMGLFANLA